MPLNYTPLRLDESPAVSEAAAERELSVWGFDADWLGKAPLEFDFGWGADKTFWRYQYDVEYEFVTRVGNNEFEYNPVEFRTYIYTVGEPPESLKTHIRQEVNGQLQKLFNSGPYDDGKRGWFAGFNLRDPAPREEDQEVAADDVNNLGIPQFEVLVKKSGSVQGEAGGFFDPFGIYEEAPEHEVWWVTENTERRSYELRPKDTRSRKRLAGKQKEVYLGGRFVGNTVPSRPGTLWLKKDYTTKDNTWKDSKTGQSMWSRRKLVDEAGIPAGGIRDEGKVYKVRETANAIFLVATQNQLPDDWSPVRGEQLPEDVADQAYLDLADCTTFNVREDTGPLMGRYETPITRDICESIDLAAGRWHGQ